jgi:hypothetical protein
MPVSPVQVAAALAMLPGYIAVRAVMLGARYVACRATFREFQPPPARKVRGFQMSAITTNVETLPITRPLSDEEGAAA